MRVEDWDRVKELYIHFTPLGVYVFLFSLERNMTDFIIYCDKIWFEQTLWDTVDATAHDIMLIKCSDDKYIVCVRVDDEDDEKVCYNILFENPRPDTDEHCTTWKVWYDDTCVDEMVINTDDRDCSWSKPSEHECKRIVWLFTSEETRVRIPEYNLDFTGEGEDMWDMTA